MRFVCVAATAALFAFTAHANEFTLEETVTADVVQGDAVQVVNVSGDIHVKGSDSPGIEVSYIVTCETQEDMDAVDVVYSIENGISFSVEYCDGWERCGSCRVDFFVTAPSGTELEYELENVNGKMILEGIYGLASVSLVNGVVEVNGFSGGLSVEVVNGDVSVEGASGLESLAIVNGCVFLSVEELSEDLTIESVNASVSMKLLCDAAVFVETMSGMIDIDEGFSPEIERNTAGCSAVFGNGERKITVSTLNGDIEITP